MGPLDGVKVVELAGLGPAPFACTLLSDLGAEVVRVERVDVAGKRSQDPVTGRGRRSVAVDLKSPAGVELVLRLVERADALVEGFRPGVTERMGLGPDACLARNPRLVYGRMTGWGQEGPLAQAAGHDIDYIGVAGALAHFGRAGEQPTPPINMVGDFGGGGMFMAFGVVCALLETRTSGQGQVVDAAMVDGIANLMGMIWGFRGTGQWDETLGVNLLDTGAPFYDTYETADGKYVAVGAIEAKFYAELLERLGLADEELPRRSDRASWPVLRSRFSEVFLTKTRDEWTQVFDGSDACVAPVLTMSEALEHPHLRARDTFTTVDGMDQPAPAPRFSRTPGAVQGPAGTLGAHTDETLSEWGIDATELAALHDAGTIAQA